MDGKAFGRTSLLCTLLLGALRVCSGTVTVTVSPKVEVLKGGTVKLPCSYTVSPPSNNVVVEWYIEQGTRKRVAFHSGNGNGRIDEGTPLTGRGAFEEDFTLTIFSVQPSDELVFYCQVTAGPAGVSDASTMLKVFFPPEKPQLTRPSSQAISVGQTTSSEIGSCRSVNGHPQPRIIWFKNDQPLPEVKDIKANTYMIPSVVKEASGLYTIKSDLYMQPTKEDKDSVFQCIVEYSMPGDQVKQEKSNTITINLYYPSEKATFSLLNSTPVKEGDNVTMKCETDGNPQPVFEFTKNKAPVPGESGYLRIPSIKRTDAGLYTCNAMDFDNLDADLSGAINLSIQYIDPVNVTPAEPQVVMLGDKVEWQCKTKASAPHTVQWKKGSEVLSQDGTLSIHAVTYDKAGVYRCVGAVPSVPGLTAHAKVNLTVKGKPMIAPPEAAEVGKEGVVTLKCMADGFPLPQFTWKPSGKESVQVETNRATSTVTLQATPEILRDGVTCEVSNEFGKDSQVFKVTQKETDNSADRVLLTGNPVFEPAEHKQAGSSGVVVAVVVCVLLLLLLVALIYFLSKTKRLPCSKKKGKDVPESEKVNNETSLIQKGPATEQC